MLLGVTLFCFLSFLSANKAFSIILNAIIFGGLLMLITAFEGDATLRSTAKIALAVKIENITNNVLRVFFMSKFIEIIKKY
jgi:hypothetical protein